MWLWVGDDIGKIKLGAGKRKPDIFWPGGSFPDHSLKTFSFLYPAAN